MIAGRVGQLSVKGFRSLRNVTLPLDHVAVYRGGNGTGKTNIYRSLEFCRHAARGDLSLWLAKQGGLASCRWSGETRTHEKARIAISVTVGDLRYHIEVGHPTPTTAAFLNEPLIKEETVEALYSGRTRILMKRRGPSVTLAGLDGSQRHWDDLLLPSETALSRLPAEAAASDVAGLRDTLLDWRFFHRFRVDTDSPLRRPAPGVTATRLDSDGANLPAVFATLEHIRQDTVDLKALVRQAFDNAELVIPPPEDQAAFFIRWPNFPQRLFSQAELSDGTLQFLALCGALLSYHPPRLVVLNEPEASLHPDLMPALASLIGRAAETTQIIVVTHSNELATQLGEHLACPIRVVEKQDGETVIAGLTALGTFSDGEVD